MKKVIKCEGRACPSCPYVKSTPLGVWDESEYRKLPEYDADTPEQVMRGTPLFMCHQDDNTVCRGWMAVHGDDAFSVRIAISTGKLKIEDRESICKGQELYGSGQEVLDANLPHINAPAKAAQVMAEKISNKRARCATQDQGFTETEPSGWQTGGDPYNKHDDDDAE